MWTITGLVLLMLGLERLLVIGACRRESGRAFLRKTPLFHPNSISLLRLPMGMLSCWIASTGNWSLATLWFAFWMITDLSDGTIARHCDLGTETGKWLDPLSDKFMYFPVLLYFSVSGNVTFRIDLIPVLLFVLFDVVGQASRLFVKKKAANLFGKVKTALVTILLSILALNQIDPIVFVTPRFVQAFMYACTILAFLSCYCKVVPDNWYANTLTLANFLCGITAIFYACHDQYIHCLVCVFIGQFFDLFDGRLARRFGSTKRGAVFDDIADATDFGLAIGAMIFFCLNHAHSLVPPWAAMLIALFYLGCVIFRLYRFIHPTKAMPAGVFQGLPSPAGAMFAGSSVLVALEFSSPFFGVIAATLVIFSSWLMVSNLPYCHFGQTLWPGMPRGLKALLFILIIFLTVLAFANRAYRPFFVWSCFLFMLFYLVYGLQTINRMKQPPVHQEEK
ncbi:MAG: CDP-alcohol phosphatidyltransferase family protein [Victivallales bacterium]|nr:CDP-alcohol phosphatidyltransferase family protein [Victivallales bacterium]